MYNGHVYETDNATKARNIAARLAAVMGKQEVAVIVRMLLDKHISISDNMIREFDHITRKAEAAQVTK